MNSVPESDWRVFRDLHCVALERFCERILLDALSVTEDVNKTHHDRYRELFSLIKKRDKEIAFTFDDFRRSTAFFQIAMIRRLGLWTDEEYQRFSSETRDSIAYHVALHSRPAPNEHTLPTPSSDDKEDGE